MTYDLCVLIGRFQIFHMRHLAVILEGLKHAKNMVVFVGSANGARSFRNPFTFEERYKVIKDSVDAAGEDSSRIACFPLEDCVYDDEYWKQSVVGLVSSCIWRTLECPSENIALLGYAKDHTSYFLDMFPQWKKHPVKGDNTSSSYMRNAYFSNIGQLWAKNSDGHNVGDSQRDKIVPKPARDFLMSFLDTPEYKEIYNEYEFITKFRKPYLSLMVKPTFNTVDVLVSHGKNVLLRKRSEYPGKGLWELPSKLLMPSKTIKGTVSDILETLSNPNVQPTNRYANSPTLIQKVFDNPERDARGRFISHAFHVKLKGNTRLPEVVSAQWWKLDKVTRQMMFSDNKDIITTFAGDKKNGS